MSVKEEEMKWWIDDLKERLKKGKPQIFVLKRNYHKHIEDQINLLKSHGYKMINFTSHTTETKQRKSLFGRKVETESKIEYVAVMELQEK